LHQLNELFKKLDIDLIKTGSAIPEGWQTPRNFQGSTEELGAIRRQIEKLLSSRLVQDYRQQAQNLFQEHPEELEKILTLQRELETYMISQNNGRTQRLDLISDDEPPPSSETKIRRDIMAGKPNANIRDCWDTTVPAQWPRVGTHEQWKEKGRRIEQLKEEMRTGLAKQNNSITDLQALAKKIVEFRDASLGASNLTEEMEGSDFFHRLGGFKEDDYIVSDGGNGLAGSQNSLCVLLMQVLPKITDENLEGKSISGLIRLLEGKLRNPPSSLQPEDIKHLREILAIAKELKIEG
jgi:hypothetical protein